MEDPDGSDEDDPDEDEPDEDEPEEVPDEPDEDDPDDESEEGEPDEEDEPDNCELVGVDLLFAQPTTNTIAKDRARPMLISAASFFMNFP